MKPTITNPTIRKTAAWISKHRYGFTNCLFSPAGFKPDLARGQKNSTTSTNAMCGPELKAMQAPFYFLL